jgi:hypothetical protein
MTLPKSMERAIETDKSRFLANQGNLSVQERARYARSLTRLVDYNDFLMHFPGDPQVLSRALDNRLFIKSLLMDSERRVKKALETSTDQELQGMHAQYDATERKLSNLRSQFGVDKRILIPSGWSCCWRGDQPEAGEELNRPAARAVAIRMRSGRDGLQ